MWKMLVSGIMFELHRTCPWEIKIRHWLDILHKITAPPSAKFVMHTLSSYHRYARRISTTYHARFWSRIRRRRSLDCNMANHVLGSTAYAMHICRMSRYRSLWLLFVYFAVRSRFFIAGRSGNSLHLQRACIRCNGSAINSLEIEDYKYRPN